MIKHIEIVDRKTEIVLADKYVDEEQYNEWRRITVDSAYYVREIE